MGERHALVETRTRAWLEQVVVALDLCPFAAASMAREALGIEVSSAADPEAVARVMIETLTRLEEPEAGKIESCLLVFPEALDDFVAFNAFLEVAERIVEDMGLAGVFQIASFHPSYRFADAPEDDAAHFTNRSPYPMLHLLRESAVERAVASHPDPEGIPARNIERLRALGSAAMSTRLREIRSDRFES